MTSTTNKKRFSLTQQLLVIVAFMLVFFVFFSNSFLNSAVDRFSTAQIYELIDSSQQNVIYNYNIGQSAPNVFGVKNDNIIHIIKTRDGQIISNGIDKIDQDLLTQISLQMQGDPLNESIRYRYKDGSLYTVTYLNDETTITTVVPYSYTLEYKNSLVSSVVNIIIIFMMFIFFILLIWVTSLIRPLNQIREYIKRIKRNEKAKLNIQRFDEIGEVADMIVELNTAIERQQRSKEEMIQNISHDLKTPIATIKSYGESIKDGVYPYETLEKSVDVIIEHANRLENKVHNLLTLNRMDYLTSNKESYEAIDIEGIAEKVIVSTSQLRKDINIILKADEDSSVNGQEEPWRVVLENILDNAIRYAKSEIIIELGDHYISVYNDGSQIDENKIKSLFNAYEMGEGGQFGLGLSIVKRVLSNYGYKIEAINSNNGVKFEIYQGDKNEKDDK